MGEPKKAAARIAAISFLWAALGAGLAFLALHWTPISTRLLHELPPQARPRFLSLFREDYPSEVAKLTQRLVGLPEAEAGRYAQRWLISRGMRASLHLVPGGRFNVLALAAGALTEDVRVVLTTHFDVVPGGPDAGVRDGKIFGRGAVDARGLMAAMMVAVAEKGDARVGGLFVSGEETDHAGMRAASAHIQFSPTVSLVNGEPTESKIATAQKGMLKVRISAKGVACHSGYPHLGSSAINRLLDVLAGLRAEQWPRTEAGETTMSIGLISGGEAANIVPAAAKASVMFRLVEHPPAVVAAVERIVGAVDGVEVEVLSSNPPVQFYVPPKTAGRVGTTEVSYNTDVAHFKRPYKRAVLFGAGSIAVAHTDREAMPIDELEMLPKLYGDIVDEILQLS